MTLLCFQMLGNFGLCTNIKDFWTSLRNSLYTFAKISSAVQLWSLHVQWDEKKTKKNQRAEVWSLDFFLLTLTVRSECKPVQG